jgi:hypothetical protein
MVGTEQQYRKQIAQLAAGNFYIVPHAIKHFRIRIVKKPKDKAEAFLREMIITAAARAEPPLHVFKSIKHNAWTAQVWVKPYSFDIAFREGNDGSGRLAIVTVIDTPGGTSRLSRFDMNQRISLKEYLEMQLTYEETLLDLEDEMVELKARPIAPSAVVLNHQLNEARNSGIQQGAVRMRSRIMEFLEAVASELEAGDINSSELIRQLNGCVAEYPLEPETEVAA